MATHVQRRAGFTLVELMIVLVIIGVMAATVAPGLTEIMADYRQFALTQEVISLVRRQKNRAWGSGRAVMLRFREADSGGLGAIAVFSGMNNKCVQTPWANQVFVNGGQTPEILLDVGYYNPVDGVTQPNVSDTGRQVIALTGGVVAGTNLGEVWICIQPNGQVFTMTASPANPALFLPQATNVTFSVKRWVSIQGTRYPHGHDRFVLFPVGGLARAQ
jgi:prepilin-type N-terminal cleavage/methylation domain-containing protein